MLTKALYQDVEFGDGAIAWVEPQKDVVKITVNAAIFTETSSFGIGMLARDDKGELIKGRSELYQGNVSPGFAEALALREISNHLDSERPSTSLIATRYSRRFCFDRLLYYLLGASKPQLYSCMLLSILCRARNDLF